MAHYAYIDDDNIVVRVIVGPDESDLPEGFESWEEYFTTKTGMTVLRTSYNTRKGQHLEGGEPFRGNYAAKGMAYDPDLDAFIEAEQPLPSWVFDTATFSWVAPTPKPDDGGHYEWDEDSVAWVLITENP